MIFLIANVFAQEEGIGRSTNVKLIRTSEFVLSHQSDTDAAAKRPPLSLAYRHPISKRRLWLEFGGWYQFEEPAQNDFVKTIMSIDSPVFCSQTMTR